MRAIGYFSIKDGEQTSLQEHEKAFFDYCSDHQHQPVATFGDAEARETVESQYLRMIDYMRISGSQFLILVPDTTHLGSNLEEVARAMVDLERTGAKVLCMDEELPDPLQNALNSLEIQGVSRHRSVRIREAMQKKAQRAQGLGRPPYGYRIGPQGRLEVVPEEAPIVQLIFQLYTTDNLGFRRIVEYLNQRSIPNRQKAGWNTIAIRDLLRNMAYLGTYTRFGLRLHGSHTPIIATEIFQKAQSQMSKRRPRREKLHTEPFVLSGLAYCGYCGNKMIGVTRRQSWKRKDGRRIRGVYRYYQCQSRTNQSLCKYHTWRASRLEEAVRDQLHAAIESGLALPKKNARTPSSSQADVKAAERLFHQAFRTSAQGLMPVALLGEYLDQIDVARKALEPQTATNTDKGPELHQLNTEQWNSLEGLAQRAILSRMVNRVVVKDDEVEVQIQTASPDSLPLSS